MISSPGQAQPPSPHPYSSEAPIARESSPPEAGFSVSEARDVMLDGHEGGEAWYVPLTASWNPLKWPRFQFNPVMFRAMPLILWGLELAGVVPEGTVKTQARPLIGWVAFSVP